MLPESSAKATNTGAGTSPRVGLVQRAIRDGENRTLAFGFSVGVTAALKVLLRVRTCTHGFIAADFVVVWSTASIVVSPSSSAKAG